MGWVDPRFFEGGSSTVYNSAIMVAGSVIDVPVEVREIRP